MRRGEYVLVSQGLCVLSAHRTLRGAAKGEMRAQPRSKNSYVPLVVLAIDGKSTVKLGEFLNHGVRKLTEREHEELSEAREELRAKP